ncbi:MAG: response regulator [Gemmata sp.]
MQRSNPNPDALKVLVVADDSDTTKSFAELLTLHGHAARVALDGASSLQLADADPPDVMLLDLRALGLSGCEVARLVRERWVGRAGRPLLVAVAGGAAQDQDARMAAGRARFDLDLVNPVDSAVLIGLLERACRIRRLFAPPTPAVDHDSAPEGEPRSGSHRLLGDSR